MEIDINKLTLGQIKEIQSILGDQKHQVVNAVVSEKPERIEKGRYIVIGNRGNVVVGDLAIEGQLGCLSNASVIRRWGTTDGLGQLAKHGAQPNTKLDHCGSFEFHIETTCGMIPVESDF